MATFDKNEKSDKDLKDKDAKEKDIKPEPPAAKVLPRSVDRTGEKPTEKPAEKPADKPDLAPEAAAPKLQAVSALPSLPPRDPARDKAIELAVSTIEKQFGKGSIMRLGDELPAPEVKVVPTGSLGLDIALGCGGLPRGRVVEIYGPESSGKTTLALHVVSEAQRLGGICAFVDAEHALDVGYARKLGVRTDDLLVSQPDCGEQALEITEMLVRSGAVDIIVVDSVAALTPKAELEGEMGDSHVGLQARLMSQALRKLTGTISKSNTLVIFINQIRMKIGVMFGNPETTTGGNALKFYASVRLDIRRIGALKDGEKVVGNRTRVKVVKNKMAPPFREVEFDILYGEGISHEGDLVDLGSECAAVEKSGAWFSFEGERIGQGRDNAKNFLVLHPDIAAKVEAKVLAHHGIKRDVGGAAASNANSGGGAGGTVHALAAAAGRPGSQGGDKPARR
jgi:recombination protein RecA